MKHPIWEDRSVIAKLAFDGYFISYNDKITGNDEISRCYLAETVCELWQLITNDLGIPDHHIKFPTPIQLGLMWFIAWPEYVPYRITTADGTILWEPDK